MSTYTPSRRCTVCPGVAAVHVTTINDGSVRELHFCQDHAPQETRHLAVPLTPQLQKDEEGVTGLFEDFSAATGLTTDQVEMLFRRAMMINWDED